MNEEDRKAFDKFVQQTGNIGDGAREAWQACCEWRDSQVGEPIAWRNYNPLTGEKWYSDSKECVNAEPFYSNSPITENQKAEGKFVWIETCDGGYWHHLYKGNEPPSTSKTVFLYASPPTAQINQQLAEALTLIAQSQPSERCGEYCRGVAQAALAATQMRGDA